MPSMSNAQGKYFEVFRSLVFNPGQKFLTQADEVNYINSAAVNIASRLGGILYVLTAGVTIASQADYTLPNTVKKIRYLELVDTTVTPNTVTFIDVVPYEQFRRINDPDASSYPFAWFRPETGVLHIEPAPTTSGLEIRLLCWGMPNALYDGSTTLFDGDLAQLNAITQEAASLARIKTRDLEEAALLHQRAMESCEAAAAMISGNNQVEKLNVGRHTHLTRLRRF